jgi:Na+/phosphate symporter
VVISISVVLLACGAVLAVAGDAPKAGTANLQTLGVGLMLVALTVLVAALTAREPVGRNDEAPTD